MKYLSSLSAALFLIMIAAFNPQASSAAPKASPSPSPSPRRENLIQPAKGSLPFYESMAEIERLLHSCTEALMAFRYDPRKELPGRLKDDLKALDREASRALKSFPPDEKAKAAKLKDMLDELRPLLEESMELQEMVGSNIQEALARTEKAKTLLRQKVRNEVMAAKNDEAKYRKALPFYYEMEINLSEMVSRNLFYIATGREDMRDYAQEDRALLEEAVERYITQADGAKTPPKEHIELKSLLDDCMRSITDAAEDYERLKPLIVRVQDKVFTVDRYIDLEIQKSPYR